MVNLLGREGKILDASFWHNKWQKNEIGFHLNETNPLLMRCFSSLSLPKGKRIFLPLCGKTMDIQWLLSEGYRVVGSELNRLAIEQLFLSLELEPKITMCGELELFSAENIDIFVGDFFQLSEDSLGKVDAVYDRAALIALPSQMRTTYAKHLMMLTGSAPQLLITLSYDTALHAGPPFSLNSQEIQAHYEENYHINLVMEKDMPDGLKGKYPATESVWHLKA